MYLIVESSINKFDWNESVKSLNEIKRTIVNDWGAFSSLSIKEKLDWLLGDAFGWINNKDSRYAYYDYKDGSIVQIRISNHKQKRNKYIKRSQAEYPADIVTDIRIYDRNDMHNKNKHNIDQSNSIKNINVNDSDKLTRVFMYQSHNIDSIHLDNLDDVKKLLDALIDCLKNTGKFVHPFTKKVIKESLSLTEYIKLNTYITEHLLYG